MGQVFQNSGKSGSVTRSSEAEGNSNFLMLIGRAFRNSTVLEDTEIVPLYRREAQAVPHLEFGEKSGNFS